MNQTAIPGEIERHIEALNLVDAIRKIYEETGSHQAVLDYLEERKRNADA